MSPSDTSDSGISSRRTTAIRRSKGPAKTSRSRSSSAALMCAKPVPYGAGSSRCRSWVWNLVGGPVGSGARGADAHGVADVGDDHGGDRPCLLRARAQDRLETSLVRPQLGVALAHGRQVIHHRIGDGALEVPVSRAVELALDVLGRHVAN